MERDPERNDHAGEVELEADEIAHISQEEITIFEIKGQQSLQGTTVEAKDLRGGAALILAGLAAEGETIVKGAKYVERGYESIDKALSDIGADIRLE